ncbi:hypothetical protein ABER23_07965 [Paenibacillus lautus]|uniref:hypothetical protein n=1 Tax=Paenibacillus lautus TaxID=1401 RepID=UPI003D2CEBCD
MELTITDEQLATVVENEIVKRIDKNLTYVIKEHYTNYQKLREVIERIIGDILEERLARIFSDEHLKSLVKSENVSKVLADKLIKVVSEDLVDQLLEGR